MSDIRTDLTTDLVTGVRSPAEAKDFSSGLCAQTNSKTHPASDPMGAGGPIPEVNRGRDVTLTTHPRLVPISRMSRNYTACSPGSCLAQRDSFTLIICRDISGSHCGEYEYYCLLRCCAA
jgi:hypothetical protein